MAGRPWVAPASHIVPVSRLALAPWWPVQVAVRVIGPDPSAQLSMSSEKVLVTLYRVNGIRGMQRQGSSRAKPRSREPWTRVYLARSAPVTVCDCFPRDSVGMDASPAA